ncbi:MAG: universal stress protein, partial [Rhodoglobus sp.]|nr:universal stress protein [Rhodoglobus sp.]
QSEGCVMGGRVVVGVDGSGPSHAALAWAAARARSTKTPLLAVHVVEDETARAVGENALHGAVASVLTSSPDLSVDTQLLHGAAPWELTRVAGLDDLLVVGTHKTGYLNGRVLGTRGIAVATGARCSVAVVPEATTGRKGILVGVASAASSRAAIVAGAHEAARTGQELTLIHAASGPGSGRTDLTAAVALAIAAEPRLVVRSRLSRRRPADALLDASRSSSLLVLGATDPADVHAHHLGSVLYEVLLNINSPVLIARG